MAIESIVTQNDSVKQDKLALERCLEQFKFLSSLAQSHGPIKSKGKIIPFKKIMAFELSKGVEFLDAYLGGLSVEKSIKSIAAEINAPITNHLALSKGGNDE